MRASCIALLWVLGACEPRPPSKVAESAPKTPASAAPAPASPSSATSDPDAPPTRDECKTSADCTPPARCCSNGMERFNRCTTECEVREACVPGGPNTCHAGSNCQPYDYDSHSGGICVVTSPSVECGGRRCSGDKPACRWLSAKRSAHCVAQGFRPEEDEAEVGHSPYMECASPRDCAGERCCASGPVPWTHCDGACTSGIDVCDTIADCPVFLGPPIGCAADPKGAPFLKTCRYGGQDED